jgi:AMP deaminase
MPTPDEIEVYRVLQRCLELREKYVFREEIAPWEKEVITDPSTPKPNPNPFAYEAEAKTDVSKGCLLFVLYCSFMFLVLMMLFVLFQHCFKMVDGVVHVYPNKECK